MDGVEDGGCALLLGPFEVHWKSSESRLDTKDGPRETKVSSLYRRARLCFASRELTPPSISRRDGEYSSAASPDSTQPLANTLDSLKPPRTSHVAPRSSPP